MDFNEPVTSHQKLLSDETPNSSENNIPAMTRLENDIDEVYTLIESKISTFWNSASRSIQGSQSKSIPQVDKRAEKNDGLPAEKHTVKDASLPLTDIIDASDPKIDLASISVLANKALDELDSKLEIVEKKAGYFVNSITSFFSSTSVANPNPTPSPDRNVDGSSPLPIIPGDAYGSSRYDMELFKLHTTEGIFLDSKLDDEIELSKFVVDDKTQEISSLLNKYLETLEKLMKKLVPTQLSYNEFWFRYFKQESKLRAGERARKELLSQRDKGENVLSVKQDPEPHKGVNAEGLTQIGAQNKANELVKAGDEIKDTKEDFEEEEEFLWDDEDDVETSDA